MTFEEEYKKIIPKLMGEHPKGRFAKAALMDFWQVAQKEALLIKSIEKIRNSPLTFTKNYVEKAKVEARKEMARDTIDVLDIFIQKTNRTYDSLEKAVEKFYNWLGKEAK